MLRAGPGTMVNAGSAPSRQPAQRNRTTYARVAPFQVINAHRELKTSPLRPSKTARIRISRLEAKPAMARMEWPTSPSVNLRRSRIPGRKKAQPVGTRTAHHARVAQRHRRVLRDHLKALKYTGTSGTQTSRLPRLTNCTGR